MSNTTIRVSEDTRKRLAAPARATGRSMNEVVDEALDAPERQAFFRTLNARYEELRADPDEWTRIEADRAAEERAVRDASE